MPPESNQIEYKRELPSSPDKLEREVVSFLNTDGGTIYFGIADDGTVCGVDNSDELQLQLKDRIKNNLSAHALDYCNINLDTESDKDVVVLKIESGWEKPFYVNKYGMTPKGCFKRVGSAVEPMTAVQIEMLFTKRVRNSLKNIPSPHDDLTFEQLHIYYQWKKKSLNSQFMKSLDLLTDEGAPNYAAYLLADENRNTVLFAKYADTTRVNLISNELYGDYCLIKSFKELDGRLEAENITFTKIIRNERLERKLIDKAALREALLNALLHNDYANGPAPKVEFFSDRVEIISYGGLPYGISEEDFYLGRSYPRNVELMRVFRDLDIVEQLGSGVPRILKAYGKEAFHISENYLTVVLPFSHGFDEGAGAVHYGLGGDDVYQDVHQDVYQDVTQDVTQERADTIISLIKENPKIRQQDIASRVGVTVKTIYRQMRGMRGVIYVGRGRNGHWEIIDEQGVEEKRDSK